MNKKVISVMLGFFALNATCALMSSKAESAQRFIKEYIKDKKKRKPNKNPVIHMVLGAESLANLINDLLSIDKLQAKAQSLMPIVQQKAKNAGDKKEELEKDKDVQEFIALSQEVNRLYKVREEIMKVATDKFSSIIFAIDNDAVIVPIVTEVVRSPNQKIRDKYQDIQELMEECVKEAHEEIMSSAQKAAGKNTNENSKVSANTKNASTKVKNKETGAKTKNNTEDQLKSTVEEQPRSKIN